MQTLHLGCRGGGKLILVIGTHTLLAVVRVVGRYIEIPTGQTIGVKTYSGESTNKNKIGVELTTLSIRDSARYKKTLLSGRKYGGES
jgi:hypothetical protein